MTQSKNQSRLSNASEAKASTAPPIKANRKQAAAGSVQPGMDNSALAALLANVDDPGRALNQVLRKEMESTFPQGVPEAMVTRGRLPTGQLASSMRGLSPTEITSGSGRVPRSQTVRFLPTN